MTIREYGRVHGWNQTYGFIAPDAGPPRLFVHYEHIVESNGYRRLEPGQRVSFERGEDQGRGPRAVRVRVEKGRAEQ